MLTLAFIGTFLLLTFSLLMALQGGHVLRRAVRDPADPLRDRAVGVAVILLSMAAAFAWAGDIVRYDAAGAAGVAGFTIIMWALAFVTGTRRPLSRISERRVYLCAVSLALLTFVFRDGVVTWAEGLCVLGLAVWLLASVGSGRRRPSSAPTRHR